MDLVVDLNFRMDTSALYSDVDPARGHLVREGRPQLDRHALASSTRSRRPCRRAGSRRATGTSSRPSRSASRELAAQAPARSRSKDVVATPLAHDTPAEIAQPRAEGLVDAASARRSRARRCRRSRSCARDYANAPPRSTARSGPLVRSKGLGAHGTHYEVADVYDEMVAHASASRSRGGATYPSIDRDVDACDAVLHLATVTNGELAYRSYANMEKKTGLAARGPRRARPRRPDVVLRPPGAAAAAPEQPDVVGAPRRRPAVRRRSPTTSSGSCRGGR